MLIVCPDEGEMRQRADYKRFMRFGRPASQQQQQPADDAGLSQVEDTREPSTSAKRFMRFGREFMRFGRDA